MEDHKKIIGNEFRLNSYEAFKFVLDKIEKSKIIPPHFLNIVENMFNSYEVHVMIENFIILTYNHWPQIKNKDEDYLIQFSKDYTKNIPFIGESFEHYIDTIEKNRRDIFSKEDEEYIWEKTFECIKLSIRYTHYARDPIFSEDQGKIKYQVRYAPNLSVNKMKEIWNLEL